jgi:hypothetical protein
LYVKNSDVDQSITSKRSEMTRKSDFSDRHLEYKTRQEFDRQLNQYIAGTWCHSGSLVVTPRRWLPVLRLLGFCRRIRPSCRL